MKNNSRSGTFFVLLSAVTFSLAGILIKIIDWSPVTINGVRSIFAAAVMFAFMKATGHKIRVNKTVIFAALCNVVMNLTYVCATKITSPIPTSCSGCRPPTPSCFSSPCRFL